MPCSSSEATRASFLRAFSTRAWAAASSPDRVARSERNGGASKRTSSSPFRTRSPSALVISTTRAGAGAMIVQSAPGAGSAVPVIATMARTVPTWASATSTGTAAVVSVVSSAAL